MPGILRPFENARQHIGLTDNATKAAFAKVLHRFVMLLPGDPWVRTDEMKERFDV